jgi:endonuclease YncB( thermonuclease family)
MTALRLPSPRAAPRASARVVALAFAALLAAAAPRVAPAREAPAPIEGAALDVQDGDSFLLRADDGRRVRVRVNGIDAPEKHQPWADASRRHLGDLLRGRRIRLEPVKQDVFDRTVARVVVIDGGPGTAGTPERDAGLAQVEAGLAWHFKRYRSDQTDDAFARYARAERDAQARGLGLWRDATPEAPWDFRARQRREQAAEAESSEGAKARR